MHRLVKFGDGKYGIERRMWYHLWLYKEYKDFTSNRWFNSRSKYFHGDCRRSLDRASQEYEEYTKHPREIVQVIRTDSWLYNYFTKKKTSCYRRKY